MYYVSIMCCVIAAEDLSELWGSLHLCHQLYMFSFKSV